MRGHTGQHCPGGTKLLSQGGAAQSCTAQIRLPLSHSLRKIEKSGESGPGACSQNCTQPAPLTKRCMDQAGSALHP